MWVHTVCTDFSIQIIEPQHDKTNKVTVRPAKIQISLGICPVYSESSLCAQWVAKDPSFLHADSKDSVFAGRTLILLGLSCRSSIRIIIIVISAVTRSW